MFSQFSVIQDAILRAAADPDAWQDVMEVLARALPGSKTHLLGYDVTLMRALPEAAAGYDDPYLMSYKAHYHGVNPYIPSWTQLPVGQVVFSETVLGAGELMRGEYYNDWLRPQDDLRNGHFTVLTKDPGRMYMFGTHFEGRASEGLMEPALRLMVEIYPLLRHALEMNRMTMGLRLDAALLRQGVEPEGASVLLVSRSGTILYANARAETLLIEGRLIQWDVRGRLTFGDPAAALRLEVALQGRTHAAGLSFRIGAPTQGHEVRLLPVTADTIAQLRLPLLLLAPSPALLAVLRPVREAASDANILRRRLGLTPAEAAVALAIADGASVDEIAERRGVSVHTVRDQIKAAMLKAETRRRSALVKLVLELRRRS